MKEDAPLYFIISTLYNLCGRGLFHKILCVKQGHSLAIALLGLEGSKAHMTLLLGILLD